MNFKFGMFSVLVLLGVMILLISSNYLITANANEDDPYYKEDQNDYSNKNIEQYDNYVQDDHNNSYNNYNDHLYDSNKSYLYTCPESGIQVDNKEKCKENLVQIKNNSNESSICNIFGNIHVSDGSNITINCNINELRKSQEKQSPMLLVNKEILFCDTIANGTSNFCEVPLPMPESDRYVQECDPENALCNNINNELFKIEVTNSIAFKGSQEGTKINLDDGKKFKVIEKQENTICSESNGELECIDKEVFVSQCKDAGFDDGVIIKQMNDGNNNNKNDNHYYNQISSSDSTTPTIIASCVLYEGECSGIVHGKELKECTVENYIVEIEDGMRNGDNIFIYWQEELPENIRVPFAIVSNDGGTNFGPVFNLTDTAMSSGFPHIAMKDNKVVAVLSQQNGDDFDIFALTSIDGGKTFGPILNVGNTNKISLNPMVAIDNDKVIVVWLDVFTDDNVAIFAATSVNGGNTFDMPITLSNETTNSFSPRVAISDDNAVVVWQERLSGNNDEIFAATSTDKGATFGPVLNVSDTSTRSAGHQMAISGDNVIVVWQEILSGTNDEIFAAISTDKGATFGPVLNVSDTSTRSGLPQVAISEDNVMIVWQERFGNNNQEIFAAISTDKGATFGPIFNVSNTTNTISFSAKVAMSGENVIVVWQDNLPGSNGDILAATSTDRGATFGPSFNLSNSTTSSFFPQVAMSGENAVIVWLENIGNNGETFAVTSTDRGATFGPILNLSNTTSFSSNPQVAMN